MANESSPNRLYKKKAIFFLLASVLFSKIFTASAVIAVILVLLLLLTLVNVCVQFLLLTYNSYKYMNGFSRLSSPPTESIICCLFQSIEVPSFADISFNSFSYIYKIILKKLIIIDHFVDVFSWPWSILCFCLFFFFLAVYDKRQLHF